MYNNQQYLHIPFPEYNHKSFTSLLIYEGKVKNLTLLSSLSQSNYSKWLKNKLDSFSPGLNLKVLITGGGQHGLDIKNLALVINKLQQLNAQIYLEVLPAQISTNYLSNLKDLDFSGLLCPIISFQTDIRNKLGLPELPLTALNALKTYAVKKNNLSLIYAYGIPDKPEHTLRWDLEFLPEFVPTQVIFIPFDYYNHLTGLDLIDTSTTNQSIKKSQAVIGAAMQFMSLEQKSIYDFAANDQFLRWIDLKLSNKYLGNNPQDQISQYTEESLLNNVLNLTDFEQKFKVSFEKLFPGLKKTLTKKKLIREENQVVRLTEAGIFYAHNILAGIGVEWSL